MDDFVFGICEALYAAAVENKEFDALEVSFDPATRTVADIRWVTYAQLESRLGRQITPEVDEKVKAFFTDLNVICKVVDHPDVGKSFELILPPDLRGGSFDQFRNRRPKK